MRPTPTRVATALLAATAPLVLAACSDPAATLPVVTPSTRGTATPTGDDYVTPSTTPAPKIHAAADVGAYLDGFDVTGLRRAAPPERAVIEACPGGPTVDRARGADAWAGTWEAAGGQRADVAVLTLPDIGSATRAVDPVLGSADACTAPGPSGGVTTEVTSNRRDIVEGMPLGRVDVTRTASSGKDFAYVGVVQIGNVLVRLTFSGPDAKAANEKGSDALARLARGLQAA